jgi:hypothetical protein
VANRKMNKLDIYAETRIWNLKLKNRNMATDDLIKEMIFRFTLPDRTSLYLKPQKIILTAKRRVMRRQTGMKKNIKTWSSKLSIPQKVVTEWALSGLLTEDNIEAVSEVLAKHRELTRAEVV